MKRLALAALSLSLSYALAETVYRIVSEREEGADDDPEWRARYRRLNEILYMPSADPELVYEPRPHSRVEMEYGFASFNGGGLRQEEEVAFHASADRRVAILGDSLVWSEFLHADRALPQQVDAALGEGFEVLNFGVSGYDTMQEAIWYERTVRRYGAETVVVVFCMNDLMIMSGPYERYCDASGRARKASQEQLLERVAPLRRETLEAVLARRESESPFKLLSRLEGMILRSRFDAAYTDEYLIMARQPRNIARFRRAVARLGQAIDADGARKLFVISPVLERWDDYPWASVHELARDAAEDAGFRVVDPLTAWRGRRDPASLRVDNLHYDASGAELLAAFIEGALAEAP